MLHYQFMITHDAAGSDTSKADVGRDRALQVLALEYQTLRAELIMRLSARYQFVGFITGATALLGAGIGYSTIGLKTFALVGLAIVVISLGLFGFYRMGHHIIRLSSRISQIENRINALAAAAPDASRLLSWCTEHTEAEAWGNLRFGYPFIKKPFK